MPEYMRAFGYFLALSLVAFMLTRNSFNKRAGKQRVNVWMASWLLIGATVFLLQNIWLFLLTSTIVLMFSVRWERERLIPYILAVCAVPAFSIVVLGAFGIQLLYQGPAQDFYGAVLLTPLLFRQDPSVSAQKSGSRAFMLLGLYVALAVVLSMRELNVTSTIRAAIALGLTTLWPFLAASKVDSEDRMRVICTALVFCLIPLSLIGLLELAKGWRIYQTAYLMWGDTSLAFQYVTRDGSLRAAGPTGGPIIFGFMFMTGIGLLLGLPAIASTRWQGVPLAAMLAVGLVSALSRGPWLGTLAILIVFVVTGRNALGNLVKSGAAAMVLFVPLLLTPMGAKIVNLLPFVGNVDSENVDYRFDLFDKAWTVIMQNPFFGSVDFLQTPEMESMRQGQGIIDIVNNYVGVALQYGFIGLGLYLLFFLVVLLGLLKVILRLPDGEVQLKLMARALFATLIGALITISTVGSLGQISYLIWLLAGLSVAHTRIAASKIASIILRGNARPAPHKLAGIPASPGGRVVAARIKIDGSNGR